MKLMKHFFKVSSNNKIVELRPGEVVVKAEFGQRSLVYTWGSVTHGKLGLGLGNIEGKAPAEFIREDLSHSAETYDELKTNTYFTYCPQPVASLLGTKVRNIVTGMQHCLAVANEGQLFAWGDNSKF